MSPLQEYTWSKQAHHKGVNPNRTIVVTQIINEVNADGFAHLLNEAIGAHAVAMGTQSKIIGAGDFNVNGYIKSVHVTQARQEKKEKWGKHSWECWADYTAILAFERKGVDDVTPSPIPDNQAAALAAIGPDLDRHL